MVRFSEVESNRPNILSSSALRDSGSSHPIRLIPPCARERETDEEGRRNDCEPGEKVLRRRRCDCETGEEEGPLLRRRRCERETGEEEVLRHEREQTATEDGLGEEQAR